MSLTANLALNIIWALKKSLDLSIPNDCQNLSRGQSFADGAGDEQADSIWHNKRTLADGANETLDLNAITDSLGTSRTIAKLKALYIKNKSTEASLIIGGAASAPVALFGDAATDKLIIKPKGQLLYIAPDASGLDITTNKNLKLEHDGTGTASLDYEILIIGVD